MQKRLLFVFSLVPSLAWAGGLGHWQLGMSPAAVQAARDCAPYKPVPATGGLECPSYDIAGAKRNVSFVFDDSGLKKIQVWFAEGASRAAALDATASLVKWLTTQYGPLESGALAPGSAVSATALLSALDAQPAAQPAKVQLRPQQPSADTFVFASVMRDPRLGHFVFLYFTPPR